MKWELLNRKRQIGRILKCNAPKRDYLSTSEVHAMISEEEIIRSSGENVIELIKEHRNDLIERLTDNVTYLGDYLSTEFRIESLSAVKLEFIKRSLLELKSTPVDLSHYAALILETRKKGSLSISSSTEQFFLTDIERTIKNYL